MTTAIEDIEDTIGEVVENMFEERKYKTVDALCKDYELAKTRSAKSKQAHSRLIKQLIAQINEYIQYPPETSIINYIAGTKKEAYYKKSTDHSGELVAYEVYVPKVDKQEYYCVIKLLSSHGLVNTSYTIGGKCYFLRSWRK